MPKFEVYLNVTRTLKKPLTVFAGDESEAGEKAVDIANGWDDVVDSDVERVEEI